MAGKKFDIPESFKPINKVIITPRVGVTVAQSLTLGKVKTNLIRSSVEPRVDLLPDKSTPSAMLGTPVVDQLIIKRNIDSVIGQDQTGDDYLKFDSIVISINQTRNIVKTAIQGRNGTVKEYISDGDFDISINGVITSTYSERTPREELENCYNLFKEPNELVVVSDFLSVFGIQYCVVMNYVFSQVEGSVNQINMDLKLLSDDPIELKLGIDPNA